MSILIPAILPTSHEDLEHKLTALYGLVDNVQIDSVDGRFASPATWPYTESGEVELTFGTEDHMLPYLGIFTYEIDLMVRDPEKVVGAWINAGVERVVLHAESTNLLAKAIADIQVGFGHAKDFAPGLLSLGIALNVNTDLAIIEPFLDRMDFVQFMGIAEIGKQGQPFDVDILRKIKSFRTRYPELNLQVDGGVSLETAPALLDAGISRLIVGSAIWRSNDIPATIAQFNALLKEHGF
jgi:ribulose-phosphate 3-epimerase